MPTTELEEGVGYPSRVIAGIDEVGYGAIAGPLVVSAVVLPDSQRAIREDWVSRIQDSKRLSPKDRSDLASKIRGWARAITIVSCPPSEIDRDGIYVVLRTAFTQSIKDMGITVDHVLLDGNTEPLDPFFRYTCIPKGDSRSLSIACASIVAKEHRDRYMTEVVAYKYPEYEFGRHKGYCTKKHKAALYEYGYVDTHRRSFKPVQRAKRRKR